MAIESLVIKDGLGNLKALSVESGSEGFIPIHMQPPVSTVTQIVSSSFDWSTQASGTFRIAHDEPNRRSLMVFNPGPHDLYICLSSNGSITNGFTLVDTASAPSYFSFILYPSGTYTADVNTAALYHGGYFVSSSTPTSFMITHIG
jgi:hypothetical protein